MAKHRPVFNRYAIALVEAPVADQTRLYPGQQGAHTGLDFKLCSRGVPESDFINLAVETLCHSILSSADHQLIECWVIVANSSGAVVGVDENAIRVGADDTVVIAHRKLGPFIRLDKIACVMPAPVGIDIIERPHHLAGRSVDRHLVLAFLVDDDLRTGAQAGRPDPGFHGQVGRYV